jgi:hypothetical protein
VLTKAVLSFEERIAACESHSGFRADIVVVYGRRLPVRGDFRPQAASFIGFVRNDVREAERYASRYLHVVQEDIPNLFLPHYLRKKR